MDTSTVWSLQCHLLSATLLFPLWLQHWQPAELWRLATWHMLLGRILQQHWTICSGRKLTAAVEVNESSTTLEQGQESQSSGRFHGGLLQSWCVSDWMRWKHIWMGQGIHMHKDLFLFIYLLICIIFNLLLVSSCTLGLFPIFFFFNVHLFFWVRKDMSSADG